MPHPRRLPRIPATGRITVRLTPEQRDLFVQDRHTPKDLGHALHRAPVRKGELAVRVNAKELDTLIQVAATHHPADRRDDRRHAALLRYLDSLEARFAAPEEA